MNKLCPFQVNHPDVLWGYMKKVPQRKEAKKKDKEHYLSGRPTPLTAFRDWGNVHFVTNKKLGNSFWKKKKKAFKSPSGLSLLNRKLTFKY